MFDDKKRSRLSIGNTHRPPATSMSKYSFSEKHRAFPSDKNTWSSPTRRRISRKFSSEILSLPAFIPCPTVPPLCKSCLRTTSSSSSFFYEQHPPVTSEEYKHTRCDELSYLLFINEHSLAVLDRRKYARLSIESVAHGSCCAFLVPCQ